MIRKVLIANRGEIAIRIAQTLSEMDVRVAAVFSDADRASPHVRYADEAYRLEGRTLGESYLNMPQLVTLARRCGADAIHPGYGFLSENAAFARACAAAGITFIGPAAEVIERMGDKIRAKQAALDADVPVVPGWAARGGAELGELRAAAGGLGYPVLLKAAAGGGGKGMRVVTRPEDLPGALDAAQREANSAFADARVFLEKYIANPRHVEVQIFGDRHGRVVHLFERDCSIQRRHQKIIEETPAPGLAPHLRAAICEAAVRLARAVGYTNAGTVEFIVGPDGQFYFLEVNTRLQVEHPVTELVVRHDLVRAQVLVAAGAPLPFAAEEVRQTGHALECRIYAEDPARSFLPATGRLLQFVPPRGPNIRVDSGVETGTDVTVHFDPLLAKLIVWGGDREEARRRMLWALEHFVVLGVTTNIEFLQNVVRHPAFRAGHLHTHFLEEHAVAPRRAPGTPNLALVAGALAVQGALAPAGARDLTQAPVAAPGPWQGNQRWRNV